MSTAPDLKALKIDRPTTAYGASGAPPARWPGLLVALVAGVAIAQVSWPTAGPPGPAGARRAHPARDGRSQP